MALKQSEVQRLMRLRGFGYNERDISVKLGISIKTVSNHLSRLHLEAEEMKEQGIDLNNIYFKLYGVFEMRLL